MLEIRRPSPGPGASGSEAGAGLIAGPTPRTPHEFSVDLFHISLAEARSYLDSFAGRDRVDLRRIQAWFDHCARIRAHPSSMIAQRAEVAHR